MKIRAFITHKLAEQFNDCQDRFSINPDTKSVALADGMSQSYQQKIWASLLVNSYSSNPEFVPNKASVEDLSTQWYERVKKYIEDLTVKQAPQYLIIMNRNALAMRKSAGATFLGIRFNGNTWKGDVLGDSCLIVLRGNRIKDILTSQDCDEFDNHPDYFDSDALKPGKGTPKQINGIVDENTSIMLVSDPFSDFLNEKRKEGKDEEYIRELFQVANHDEFEALVDKWRKKNGMHNDDSTLIIIEYDGADDFSCSNVDDIQLLISEEQKQQELAEPKEENDGATQNEPAKEAEPIVVEPAAKSITEKEFVKMLLDEYNSKNSQKFFGRKFTRKNVEKALRATGHSLFKKLNITKK